MPILDPTQANILSSLDVKGSTKTGGSGKSGYLPVLGDGGVLSTSLLPTDALSEIISIIPFGRTAFIDPTAASREGYSPDGSVSKPFAKVSEASSAGFTVFFLDTGNYGIESAALNVPGKSSYAFFCSGRAYFSNLTLYGYPESTEIRFFNVAVGTLLLDCENKATAVLDGLSEVGTLKGTEVGSDKKLSVRIGPTAIVSNEVNVGSKTYTGSSARIANASTDVVGGATLKEAVDSLGTRKIRVPKIGTSNNKLKQDGYEEKSVDSSTNAYDLSKIAETLVTAANSTFHSNGSSPTYSSVAATSISASSGVSAAQMTTTTLKIGTANPISVDSDGFLTIS